MFIIALHITSAFFILGTFIRYMREQTWWLRAWTYARLQLIFVLLILIFLQIFFGDESALSIGLIFFMGVGILACLTDVLPFTKVWSKQTRSHIVGQAHKSIRLFVGNVLMDNQNHGDYLQQIRDSKPDLVFLVETDETWREGLSSLAQDYPYQYELPLPDYNGMLFYSKLPIVDIQERYLVQDHIPSLTFDLSLDSDKDARVLRFYGVHPRPPRPQDDTADLDKELLFVANEVGHFRGPVIVTGDLNDVGWSTTTKAFLRMSGLQDPRIGRGLYNSYNAKNPLARWPLDHVFHSKHFSLISMSRLKAHGSDHFPLLIELGLMEDTLL
jgi:endonuclease/exonuclease/phosphatase (EEP) superfamily protein YafD